jgi:hypothetical protein
VNASLSRFLLLLASASDNSIEKAIQAVHDGMTDDNTNNLNLDNFFKELQVFAQPANLHFVRSAILDFFFQYKLATAYPNDLSPYELQRSAHLLDSYVTPIMDSFNQDVDQYIRCNLVESCPEKNGSKNKTQKKEGKVLSASFGEIQVATISGKQAVVNGTTNNSFDITETGPLSVLLTGLSSSGSGSGSSSLGSALAGILRPKEIEIAQAITNVVSQPKVYAQVSRNAALTITPTSLDTASSAELAIDFDLKDPSPATGASASAPSNPTVDQVTEHHVTTTVRVESLKLFQISGFTLQETHDRPSKCWSFSPICVVWKAVVGIPGLDGVLEISQTPQTKDNRSVAVVRAVIVPTAMDLGLTQEYENDRVSDPVTNSPLRARSVGQLLGNVRAFHKDLVTCISQQSSCFGQKKLSASSEDLP